jgi:hypothetical protein
MNTLQKRFLLFLFGCIGTRFLFVYIAKTVNTTYLPYLGYLAILPAVGFLYIFITKSRETGSEVFGEKIWWNNLRPLHSIFYGLFAYNAIQRNTHAWVYLFADVLFGLVSFFVHHYQVGSFSKRMGLFPSFKGINVS